MDRDGRGKPSPGEFSSFDLSKMSEAEVAAELAARMARWRRTHKGSNGSPDGETREPRAARSAARPTASQPPAAPHLSAAEPSPPREAGLAIAARIDRARRIAAQVRAARGRGRSGRHAAPYGAAFSSLLAEGPNMNAIGMRPEDGADQAPPAERATGVGAQEVRLALSRAPKVRVLSRRLQSSIGQALRHARALGARTQKGGIAAWRELKPALEARVGRALKHAHAIAAGAREAASTACRTFKPALATRVHQAMQRAHTIIAAIHGAGIAAWRASGPLLEHALKQAQHHARTVGAAAWQARTDRFAMAGFAAIAIAIAGWIATMPDQPAPSDVARSPESQHQRAIAGASAATELSQIPRPREIARPPQPPSAPHMGRPDGGAAFLAPMLKPATPWPTLAARLKPAKNASASERQEQPEAQLQETGPLTGLPPPAPTDETNDGIPKHTGPRDIDSAFGRMFREGF